MASPRPFAAPSSFSKACADRPFCVVFLEGLFPLVGHRTNFWKWFGGRQSEMVAVDDACTCGLQLAESGADGDQVCVHQLDQRPAPLGN